MDHTSVTSGWPERLAIAIAGLIVHEMARLALAAILERLRAYRAKRSARHSLALWNRSVVR
jgi:hypothetical protein